MKASDAMLVVLAAANRDPAANPEPGRFDPFRPACQAFTFGIGPHVCPGEAVATTIAEAGVERLLACGVQPERLVERVSYRPVGEHADPSVRAARRIGIGTLRDPGSSPTLSADRGQAAA